MIYSTTPISAGLRRAMGVRVMAAAVDKAIAIESGTTMVLIWDESFRCRAYSTEVDNLHFSVPELNDVFCNFSAVVTVS